MIHLLINTRAYASISIVGMAYCLFCTGILITQCRWSFSKYFLVFHNSYLNALRSFDLQILMTSNSFHQQFAKQTSSVALRSDLFEAWYPGLWNKCHWVLGSFSGNPRDLHTGHTQSKPITALENKSWQVTPTLYGVFCNTSNLI